MLREISQRKTKTVLSLTCGIKKIKRMNEWSKTKQTHRYGQQIKGYQWGQRGVREAR